MDTKQEILKRREELLKETLSYLPTPAGPFNIGMLRFNYGQLGECKVVVENDLLTAKKLFYKSARSYQLQFEIARGKYNIFQKEKPSFGVLVGYISSCAILCDHPTFFKEFVLSAEDYKESYLIRSGYYYHVAMAFKHFYLGEKNAAIEHISKATTPSGLRFAQRAIGYSDVLLGMLTQNVQLIEGGVKKSIAYHKKMKKSLFIEFCLEATAMVKLAKMYGFEVSTDSSYIHQGLLQHDPDIVFEDIDEVYEALGITKT